MTPFAVYKPKWPSAPVHQALTAIVSIVMLAGCSSGPKVPDWKINAIGHIERFTEAYLKGDERVEAREFALARAETARTGKPDQVARIELNRCATRVASLVFEPCAGFEPLRADAYRQTLWQRFGDMMNSRALETWVATGAGERLTGLMSLSSQWGRSHWVVLRVHPDYAGLLERPLLAKAIRRLQQLPRRNVRIDHPDEDIATNTLLAEANFAAQRTLTHMRLDLSR